MSKSATKLAIEDPVRTAALVYLADRAYEVLIGREEPAKTGEILREIDVEDMTLRMIRHTLASSERFEAVDRRWMITTRYADKQQAFERIVEEVIAGYGRTMPVSLLAQELSATLDRDQSYYETILPRLLSAHEKFFEIEGERYGLSSWLTVAERDDADDVLFDNFLEADDIKPYKKVAAKVEWDAEDIPGSVERFVTEVGHPVPVKLLGFFAWEKLREDSDPVAFYASLEASDKVTILSTQEAISSEQKQGMIKTLQEFSSELEEMPMEAEEEAAEARPLTITEADRDEIVELVEKRGGVVGADEILESVLEIEPGERGFEAAIESLRAELQGEERIMRVGPDLWRPAGSLPEYINEIPEVLVIPPVVPFETPEGDVFDQELEDEGLDAGLRQEIMNPLVQDIGDEDPESAVYQPLDVFQRLVLKYHHKEAGTMPMIQFHPDFFGTEPKVQQITLIDEGKRRDVWINLETRLMYGLKDFYTTEMPVSGAAIEIHKTERPGEYRFVYDNRTDAQMFVPTQRLLELLELKDEFESGEMPLFDIITRILEHYRKGIAFVPLFAEVNLVRRVPRRLVASILSSYHCFHTRGKTGEWQYDEKKRSQGFNKAKRKYIKK